MVNVQEISFRITNNIYIDMFSFEDESNLKSNVEYLRRH